MFHEQVIGTPSANLDLFLFGERAARSLVVSHAAGCGFALMEGVMGYYDGVGCTEQASSYAVSRALRTPAVLVLGGGASLSLAAQAKGMASFRPDSGIAGIVFNRISPALYPALKAAIEAETGLPVYGYLPYLPDCKLESRHLGLVTPDELGGLRDWAVRLAEQAEKTLDVDGLLALAHTAPPLEAEDPAAVFPELAPYLYPEGKSIPVAIARDKAFCFYYEPSLALLEALGIEWVPFSPLADQALPDGVCGLYLGGGYPELYARELSENTAMRRAVREAVGNGLPCIAECGGFLYLHASLEGADGAEWPMSGVISARAYRGKRMRGFGYVRLTAEKETLLCDPGDSIRSHEFHYWQSGSPGDACRAEKAARPEGWHCVHAADTLWAGFPHLHFYANPKFARRFLQKCRAYGYGWQRGMPEL